MYLFDTDVLSYHVGEAGVRGAAERIGELQPRAVLSVGSALSRQVLRQQMS